MVITTDGSYAARLARTDGGLVAERWTLDGPEPYAVRLPVRRPEPAGSEVSPLADGRVLIRRPEPERQTFALLYPAGAGTGELPLGILPSRRVTLLPPTPGGSAVYALAHEERHSTVWRVHGGSRPEPVGEVPGRCTGGSWLDVAGTLLAVNLELDGRTKAIALDLRCGALASPLLQITETSNDRLLLADPDSGLLLVRSDAPGRDRVGWGVLGSSRPVRFPDCLDPDRWPASPHQRWTITPIAARPGQALLPESSTVAFRLDPTPTGSTAAHPPGEHGGTAAGEPHQGRPAPPSAPGPPPAPEAERRPAADVVGATGCVGLWSAAQRSLRPVAPPPGWVSGAGVWSSGGELRLPYLDAEQRCHVARLRPATPPPTDTGPASHPPPTPRHDRAAPHGASVGASETATGTTDPWVPPYRPRAAAPRPVPLQQAPLARA